MMHDLIRLNVALPQFFLYNNFIWILGTSDSKTVNEIVCYLNPAVQTKLKNTHDEKYLREFGTVFDFVGDVFRP